MTAETMETVGVIRDRAQEERLDKLLQELAEKRAEQILSLDDLMGEPRPLGTAWPKGEGFYLSPKIRELKRIWRGIDSVESIAPETLDDTDRIVDDYAAIAQLLILVRAEDGYRRPTIDEIQARYDMQELKDIVSRMLRKDGFTGTDDQGNA